jgi:hypothetical protein
MLCVVYATLWPAAPSNTAFEQLPSYMIQYLNATANVGALVSLLAYHVVPVSVVVANFIPDQEFLTAEGDPIYVEFLHGVCTFILRVSAFICCPWCFVSSF